MNLGCSFEFVRRVRRATPVLAIALAASIVLGPQTADAQLAQVGGAVPVYTSAPQGTDAAFDPVHQVYLVVGGFSSVHAVFVNTSGTPVSGLIMISPTFGFHPRVKYSPHVNGGQGGFLVAYHSGSPTAVHSVLMSYPAGVISSPVQLGSIGSNSLQGPGIAYSTTSGVFLVTWTTYANGGIDGRLVGANGVPVGAGPTTIQAPSNFHYQFSSASWNPWTNEFGVAYAAVDGGTPFIVFRRVSGGGVSGPTSFGFGAAPFTTNVDVNPTTGNYLVAWYNGAATNGALLDPSGTVLATGLVLGQHAGQDNLGLAYNPASGTFLVGGAHIFSEVVGAELNASGAPITGAVLLTSGQGGTTYWPRLTAQTNYPRWNVFFSKSMATITNQIIQTSSTNGGPAGSLGAAPAPTGGGGGGIPPPPPPPPPSGGCTSPDPFANMGGGTCVAGGWFPPSGGGTGGGNTSSCTTLSPGAGWTCANGGWLPPSGGGGSTGGCTTADPFRSMGGGTCVSGGWFAPTGGGGSAPPPSPPPPPPSSCTILQPAPGWTCVQGGWLPPTPSSCTIADPFTSMGGGTCVNGGWFPPSGGGGGSTPPPPPPPTGCTILQPAPGWTCVQGGWLPPAPSSCTIPDPFKSMGGGTCVSGGWFPPTGGGGSTGASAPPPPPSAPSSCTIPNPFIFFGRGTCVNGGWLLL